MTQTFIESDKSGKKGAARENAFTSECMSESFSLDDAIECASS